MLAKMYSKQNYFVSRSEKWYNFGKRFHKIKQNQVSESAISLLRKDPRETKLKKKKKNLYIFTEALFTIAMNWKQVKIDKL